MPKFRKKPVVIEARQWTGANFDELFKWGSPEGGLRDAKIVHAGNGSDPTKLTITTLEGNHIANVGDWIIKGVAGEFYPCKPEIFAKTYEDAE